MTKQPTSPQVPDTKRIVAVLGPRLDEYGVPIEIWKEVFAHLIKDEV